MADPTSLISDPCSAWYEQALKAYEAAHYEAVVSALEHVFALNGRHAEGLHLRGLVAFALGDTMSAQDWTERALEVQPHPVYYNSLCVIQVRLGAFDSAVRNVRQGLALQPDWPMLHYNEGGALQRQGNIEDAATSYRRALELAPNHSSARNNLGIVLIALDELDEAEQHCRHAVTVDPGNREAHSNLGVVLLTLGRYEEAWPFFEHRREGMRGPEEQQRVGPVQLSLPRLRCLEPAPAAGQAGEPVEGGRLLVSHEQGYGDALQFARYLPMALARFSQVGYACPQALWRLFEHSFCSRWPNFVLLGDLPTDLGAWDWHCPLLSLPMAFGTRLDTVPAETPYLYADEVLSARWRTRLAALPQTDLPRVGVVWAGGNTGWDVDVERSLAPAQIASLLAWPHVSWISLQKTDDLAKRAHGSANARLIDWMDDVTDFADTAALIDNLDLVISVDTSVAHLAASMGKPVWLLNRFAGCWRWLRGRDDSPWYPGMRLFTQRRRGDWADVLARVIAALEQELPQRRSSAN